MEGKYAKSDTTQKPRKSKKLMYIVVIIICVVGFPVYKQKEMQDIRGIVEAEYDSYIENYDYSNTAIMTVDKIDYKINKISGKSGTYTVDVTWYFDISDSIFSDDSALRELIIDEVGYLLRTKHYNYHGGSIGFDYTKKKLDDSVRVVVNGGNAYSGSAKNEEDKMRRGDGTDYYGHNKYDAMSAAQSVVKKQLKSPSSAVFCSVSDAKFSCNGESWTISGWVDAQNSFGAVLRNTFTVKITFTSKDEYKIDSCNIDSP